VKYASALPALGIALAVLGPGSFARAQGDCPITVAKPADQLCLLSADQGEYATGAIAFAGEGTEAHKEAAEGLGKPLPKPLPKHTINTHTQVEYVGGNAIVGNEPTFIARELTPLKLRGESFVILRLGRTTFARSQSIPLQKQERILEARPVVRGKRMERAHRSYITLFGANV
jgi:hypothetical protein